MTVREIATITGLSPATVYRILKDPDNASRKSYKKVQEVVGDIIKKPEKLQQVYIVLPHMNNFYTVFLMEAISILRKHGIPAIPFITNEDSKAEKDFISKIPFSQRIGFIWNPTNTSAQFPFMSRTKNKPLVLTLNRTLSSYEADLRITLENRETVAKIVDIIAENQHTKILLINGSKNYNTAQERLEGFIEGIKKYDKITWGILESNYSDWKDTYNLLIEDPSFLSDFDAVISTNESISYGLLKACKDLNISIPNDLAFFGIDYATVFEALSLSTAHFSPQKIAQKAVELLIKKSQNRDIIIHQKFVAHIQFLGSEIKNLYKNL